MLGQRDWWLLNHSKAMDPNRYFYYFDNNGKHDVTLMKMEVFRDSIITYILQYVNQVQICLGTSSRKLRGLLFATTNCKISKDLHVSLSILPRFLDHQTTGPKEL